MIAREDLMTWELGAHGSTYGGSPLSCAAALATFDVIERRGPAGNARAVGEVMLNGFARHRRASPAASARCAGRALWIGLGFADHDHGGRVEHRAFREGLLVLTCGDDAIRISPPLVFREDQARAALEILEEAVADGQSAGS